MDDRTFDEQTARQWIRTIEDGANPVREQDLYPLLRAWVERIAPTRILEVGCGQGDCSRTINLTGRSYVGVDPSPFLIQRARELYASEMRRFQMGNAYALPFTDGHFDAVFTVMVWHLLSEIQTAAREMSRVTTPGGHFLIVTANPEAYAEWTKLYTNVRTDSRRFEGDMLKDGMIVEHDVLHFHRFDEMVNALTLAGFEIGSIEPFRKSGQGRGREYLVAIRGTRSP